MTPMLVLFALVSGCAGRSSAPMQPTAALLQVTPPDGATGVRLDNAVTFDFGTVVDRNAVEDGVHLLAEPDMFTGCPDPSMDHGTMDSVMNDPSMLRHMDEFHSTMGKYSWNAAGTICTFRPDSLMQPQTRYMVHIDGSMLEMMRRMGGTTMGGSMNDGGDLMLHFQTMSADDHAGHH